MGEIFVRSCHYLHVTIQENMNLLRKKILRSKTNGQNKLKKRCPVRTIIFGVDGLTFRVLHPLIERGELPNFQKLSQEGCESVLESKYPPLTPPAWTSLSTGLKPARHGVFDFWTYDEQQEAGKPRK